MSDKTPEPIPDTPLPPGFVEVMKAPPSTRPKLLPPILVPVNYGRTPSETSTVRKRHNSGATTKDSRIPRTNYKPEPIASKSTSQVDRCAVSKVHRVKTSDTTGSIKKSLKRMKISSKQKPAPKTSAPEPPSPALLPCIASSSHHSPEPFYPQDPSPPSLETANEKTFTEL